ncbi:hypothetical protein DPSP01_013456 [Paraphaeosphaeria sporulosa]
MRSALVIATFALSVLAAPVPDAVQTPNQLKTFVNERGFFRSSDGHTTSDTRDLSERDIDSEEVEKRGFRANNKARSVSEDINVDVQSVEYEDEEEHVEARGFRGNQRSVEARRFRGNQRSVEEDEASEEDQELEARGFRSNQRSVEERGFRSNQRSVEERGFRSNQRSVEERGFRSNQRSVAGVEARGFRSNQKRSTWASGLIEALKARGFSSAALVQPK